MWTPRHRPEKGVRFSDKPMRQNKEIERRGDSIRMPGALIRSLFSAAACLSGGPASAEPDQPMILRGGAYMGFPERFNRYYADPAWKPSQILHVSPDAVGDGTTSDSPMPVAAAITAARPATLIRFAVVPIAAASSSLRRIAVPMTSRWSSMASAIRTILPASR